MRTPLQWIQTLQLCDSFFPLGAFAYSDGLETAVIHGQVTQGSELEEWMSHWLFQVFRLCEGPACCQIMQAWKDQDWKIIQQIDTELTAIKPASANRKSSHSLGKRFLNSCLPLYPESGLEQVLEKIHSEQLKGNLITMYTIVFTVLNLSPQETLSSIGYTRMAGMISASLRLMPLGQQEGQLILSRQLQKLPAIVEHILNSAKMPIMTFAPLTDIAQMNHQHLYSRLFRS